MEPLNYRRLLDRSVTCNWKYIVDKIVCNNDQQASIFLQQKLKVGTTEQKYEIIEAIVAQAYPLMVNRWQLPGAALLRAWNPRTGRCYC